MQVYDSSHDTVLEAESKNEFRFIVENVRDCQINTRYLPNCTYDFES